MQKNNSIDKLDSFLSSKKNSEVMLLSLVTFVAIIFIIYNSVFPVSESFLNEYIQKFNKTSTDLAQNKRDQSAYEQSIPRLKVDIENFKVELSNTQYTNNYVDSKLKELSYLLFNDKTWASFMDRIAFIAKKYNVTIIKISNDFLDENEQVREKVEQILNVGIEFNSEFKNLIKFINEIEESQLVVDVNKINLVSARRIDGNMSISVWGMLY